MSSQHECPYCGEEFDEELDKGIHISEEHTNTGDSISRSKRSDTDKNLLDEWDRESQDMLAYKKCEEAENVASGKRYYLETPIVLDGESYESIVLADGNGFGQKTVGVFVDDSLLVEENSRNAALCSLIMESDNFELRAVEVDGEEQEIKKPDD